MKAKEYKATLTCTVKYEFIPDKERFVTQPRLGEYWVTLNFTTEARGINSIQLYSGPDKALADRAYERGMQILKLPDSNWQCWP